ncbi:MAG: threonine aldolase [Bacteroidales bacterium]|jgi:threonine aldolase|nr:threonine aldolase [Bacteroidales bacterium]
MYKISFKNDYSEGAHPRILEILAHSNMEQMDGYGLDPYSLQAMELIRTQTGMPAAPVYILSGGTQTNAIVISHLLRPYQSVMAVNTGHIHMREAGAIEATGHRVTIIPDRDGKVTPEDVAAALQQHPDEHCVQPALVYISFPTETGLVYTREELHRLSDFCRHNKLLLYADGARLGAGLTSPACDITLPEFARLVDAFYIGGTKNGALLGEAVVFSTPDLDTEFRRYIKQHGALLAKGRLLGTQFVGLFERTPENAPDSTLFFRLAKHANKMAAQMTATFNECGIDMLVPPQTNQLFPILSNSMITELEQKFDFFHWETIDSYRSAIRLVTSWATPEEHVEEWNRMFKYLTI